MPARPFACRGCFRRSRADPPYRRRQRGPPGRPGRGAHLDEQPPPEPAARSSRLWLVLGIAGVVLLADLVTKVLVVGHIAQGHAIRLLGGAVYLTQARNPGAAFSFAEGATVVFSLIAVAVAVVIVRTARRLYSTGWAVVLGLVLGGALGNLVDRIFRSPGFLRGAVVDFVSLFAPDGSVWPIFNVADSAIVCGALLGVLLGLRRIELDGSRAGRLRDAAGR